MPFCQSCKLLSLALLFAFTGFVAQASEFVMPEMLKVGETAPVTTLKNLDLEPVEFPKAGSYSLVFYWSLFCHSCLGEIPEVNTRLSELDDERIGAFFVSLDTERMHKGLVNFCKRRNLTLPVLMEEIVDEAYLSADKWGVVQTPSAFIVDPEGTIVFSHQGPLDLDSYFADLKTMLNNSELEEK